MSSERPLAKEWETTIFPAEDGTKLANQIYNNIFLPAALCHGATQYFVDNPRSEYLTIIAGGQRVPPDTSAFYVTLEAIQKAGGLFHRETLLIEDTDTQLQDLQNTPPVILHRPLPSPEALRNMPRITSHDALFRRKNPGIETGIGYVALCRTADGPICLAGYGNLRSGEQAQKVIHLDQIARREKMQGHTKTVTNFISVPHLGPVL